VVSILRRERLDDTKWARLVNAAIAEFAEHGFKSASYNRIIERSGLSKGTVYYYFDNKNSLLATILDDLCGRFLDSVGDLELPAVKEEYWDAVWEYHKRVIHYFSGNLPIWRVMRQLSEEGAEPLEASHERTLHVIDGLLARGQELGTVRNDLPLETIQRLLHAVSKVIMSAAILGDPEAAPDEDRARVDRFIFIMHDLGRRMLTPAADAPPIEAGASP
jgi:AcrR family transcriptional regulator